MRADFGVPVDDRPPDFLTVEEAGAVLRLSRGKAYELAREYLATGGMSGMPVIRLGRQLRVPRAMFEQWIGGPITWPAKTHSVDSEVLHAGWAEQTRQLGHDPATLVADAVDTVVERRGIDKSTRGWMIDQTIVAMSEKRSTWRPTQLHRELAALVPTETAASATQLTVWLDDVVDEIVTARCVDVSKPVQSGALLRRDGRPANVSVADRALTTQAILDQEQALIEWVDRSLSNDTTDDPGAAGRSSKDLDAAQTAAACAVAGDADIVLVVGPAGTGKTTALAPAVAQIRAAGRVVTASTRPYAMLDSALALAIQHSPRRRDMNTPSHLWLVPVGHLEPRLDRGGATTG